MELDKAIRNNCLSDLISMYVDKNKTDEMFLQILLKDINKLINNRMYDLEVYGFNEKGEIIHPIKSIEKGEITEEDYKILSKCYQILNDIEKLKSLITRIEYLLNPTTTHTTDTIIDKPKQSKEQPKYTPSELLVNYQFWNDVNTKIQGRINIFNNITEQQFFEMIDNANFSMIVNKHGYSKRVKYNIAVLSRILGKEWGERAAKRIKITLKDCSKNSRFYEFDEIKNMYLP